MFKIEGKYNTAKVMLDGYEDLDGATYAQILEIVNSAAFVGEEIAIMPDCHKGMDKGSPIGFTMPVGEYVLPSTVGVDIGCGMSSYVLKDCKEIDFKLLDTFIRSHVPLGTNVRQSCVKIENSKFEESLESLANKVKCKTVFPSIGSLGSGNHYLEVDKNDDGTFILVVHSGSRNLGQRTCLYHEAKAKEVTPSTKELNGYIGFKIGTKEAMEYLVDMRLCQEYAQLNRFTILEIILKGFFDVREGHSYYNDCTHNYISPDDFIIRKGSIDARKGKDLIIPLNMRDGAIFGEGNSNKDWNFSAPHGAGRVGSRKNASNTLSLDEFHETMKGVYSTSVGQHTLDEAPAAYKDSSMIIEAVKEVVDIKYIAKPVYNIKA